MSAAFGVLIAGALAYGAVGSGAWFTDSDTVPVSATAATIDVEAIGPNSTSITVSNLLPGESSTPYQIHVYNTGNSTVPIKYRIRSSDPEVAALFNALNAEVRHGNCVGTALGHDNSKGIVYSGALNVLEVTSPDDSITAPTGALPVNTTHCYSITFSLDSSAGNSLQGATATFDLVIDATQLSNPGWSQ
jgi:predicted ribosomally synthesized peptide with SipW-like signal peptide